jgi:hypothetical protein
MILSTLLYFLELCCSGFVEDPEGFVGGGADLLHGIGMGRFEHFGDGGFFGGADDVDDDVGRLVDARIGEGHPPGVFLRDVVGSHEMVVDGEGGGIGEEGSGVTIFTHAKGHEIKGASIEDFAKGIFVGSGVFFDLELGNHPVDMVGRNRHPLETSFHGHVIIAFGIEGRNASFIAPKEVDFCPVDKCIVGGSRELLVEGFGG